MAQRRQDTFEPSWIKNRIAPEGTDGLYSQTWYPVCRTSKPEPGQILGREFLDGREAVRFPDARSLWPRLGL